MRAALITAIAALAAALAIYESLAARRTASVPPTVLHREGADSNARAAAPPPRVVGATPSEAPLIHKAEEAPLPRSLADFPQTEEVQRGWRAVRSLDIYGFGERYTLAYLGILADLQQCTRGRVQSRGRMHIISNWTLQQRDGHWWGKLQSVDPADSELSEADDTTVLKCLDATIGREVELDDNKSGEHTLTAHWGIAFPLRESRIYRQILSGGAGIEPQQSAEETRSSVTTSIQPRRRLDGNNTQ